MAEQRHLTHAPIVEAILDFRVKLRPAFDVTAFTSLKETLHDYPYMEDKRLIVTGFGVAGKQVQSSLEDKGLVGYFFKSHDEKNIVQFRKDGFTFSRLYPYTEWALVSADAKRLWELYRATAMPEEVTRVALRYINKLSIPLPIRDFDEYLNAPPAIPKTLPQELSQFMTRVVIRDPGTDIQANIIQALQQGDTPEVVTIILDIDVSRQRASFEEGEIWSTFEQLHILKNRIFFDSITERAAILYE